MSYIKQGFASGQTLKADHLNHMEEGIEAIANNVQIKKAVFTDRQSVYEFLLENHEKTIYIGCQMTGYAFAVKFIPQVQSSYAGTENHRIDSFTLVELNMFIKGYTGSADPVIVPSCIQIDENTTHYLFDPKIGFNSNEISVVEGGSVNEMPDAYWSAMNVEMTAYYFSE